MTGAVLGAWVLLWTGLGATPPVYFNAKEHCEEVKKGRHGDRWTCYPTGFPEVKR